MILTIVSENILADSITATGLMITFYLGITGVACVIYFRKALFNDRADVPARRARPGARRDPDGLDLRQVGDRPVRPGQLVSGESLLGMGPPLTIALLGLLLGVVLMVLQWRNNPTFFRRKREAADAEMRL